MLNRIFNTLILGVFALVISTTFISCQKAKDTIGIIIVKDSSGNTVSGATVLLHQDGLISPQGSSTIPDLRKTDKTDANGRAEFTYPLEAILQVDVEKIDGNNIYVGSNIIRLLKEKTVTQVVEIN
jgi:hypothetical protein